MPDIVPYLRLTRSELECVRAEVEALVAGWVGQWCSLSPHAEVEAVDLERLPATEHALRWGRGQFWIGMAGTEALDTLFSLALFGQGPSPRPHALVARIIARAREALLASLLQQDAGTPSEAEVPALRGRSASLTLRLAGAEATLLLSPTLVADILEQRFHREPQLRWGGYTQALADERTVLEAVLGSATISLNDFMALEAGDIVALDTDELPCLRAGGSKTVASILPCLQDKHQAVLINRFVNT